MKIQSKRFSFAVVTVILNSAALFAQSSESRPAPQAPISQTQDAAKSTALTKPDATAGLILEIGQLRKSLQTLNIRLRDVSEKLAAPETKPNGEQLNLQQNRILLNIEILNRAEQRAGSLRKQLIEIVEKENSIKSRLIQLEEDTRSENIERSLSAFGSTRAPELRDNRRRALESERSGLQSLQIQISQSRTRLEEDVRQAELLVETLRRIVFPAIQKEIQNLNKTNQ